MKKFLFSVLVGLSAATAFANEVLDLSISDKDINFLVSLDTISDVKVVSVPGPKYAAVLPTVHLQFSAYSCARQEYTPVVLETESAMLVTVKNKNDLDCMGPRVKYSYDLQIASGHLFKSVIVLNPLHGGKVSNVSNPPRFCTAIAGVLMNPKTNECVNFTNGCQQADLLAQGYVRPLLNECENRF